MLKQSSIFSFTMNMWFSLETATDPGIPVCVCVCVCVFTPMEGEVQVAPVGSSPSLPCTLGDPITPSGVALSLSVPSLT